MGFGKYFEIVEKERSFQDAAFKMVSQPKGLGILKTRSTPPDIRSGRGFNWKSGSRDQI
jgi:hypothetical protein